MRSSLLLAVLAATFTSAGVPRKGYRIDREPVPAELDGSAVRAGAYREQIDREPVPVNLSGADVDLAEDMRLGVDREPVDRMPVGAQLDNTVYKPINREPIDTKPEASTYEPAAVLEGINLLEHLENGVESVGYAALPFDAALAKAPSPKLVPAADQPKQAPKEAVPAAKGFKNGVKAVPNVAGAPKAAAQANVEPVVRPVGGTSTCPLTVTYTTMVGGGTATVTLMWESAGHANYHNDDHNVNNHHQLKFYDYQPASHFDSILNDVGLSARMHGDERSLSLRFRVPVR